MSEPCNCTNCACETKEECQNSVAPCQCNGQQCNCSQN